MGCPGLLHCPLTQTSDFLSSKCERVKRRESTCIKDIALGQQESEV
jgi:hypothetical protein